MTIPHDEIERLADWFAAMEILLGLFSVALIAAAAFFIIVWTYMELRDK